MKKRITLIFIMLISITSMLSGQGRGAGSSITLKLLPNLDIPFASSSEYYKLGGSGVISAAYKPPIGLPFFFSLDLGYSRLPFNLEESKTLNIASVGAGVGAEFQFFRRLALNVYAKGGFYYGFTKDDTGNMIGGGNPYIWAGADLFFYFTPSLSFGAGATYKNYLGKPQSLLSSLGVYLGSSYRFHLRGDGADMFAAPPARPALLELSQIIINNIFPVFYQYYDEHPIGRAVIHNKEKGTIKNIKVSVFIKRYMDSPKVYELAEEIKGDEKKEVDLYALFTEKVLEITEGTKVAADITFEYEFKGQRKKSEHIETIKLDHRNASIWDDDRRAAAFVTAKDPVVLRFAKNIAGLVRNTGNQVIDINLRTGLALHQSLALYGMSYVVDPNTPYEEFVKKKYAVDFLQFPRQTLEYLAGDCDDLSILYAAMLESVSIDTAFITAPGHIYIAFALDMGPEVARRTLLRPDDLIFRDNKVWLPLEVTEIQGGFLRAWEAGAREWREYSPSGRAEFFPIAEAWQVFEPVGLPGEGQGIEVPPIDRIADSYVRELSRFVEREIYEKVDNLQNQIASSGNNPRLINRLGVLYARYGLTDKAEQEFKKVLEQREYMPALMNLGNIYYLKKEMAKALEYYSRAQRLSPDRAAVLLGLARVNHELEDYGEVQKNYSRLEQVSPELADKFGYLALKGDTSARAGEIGKAREVLLWEE